MITRAQTKLIHSLRSRKRRDEQDAFLVEGVRLVEELLASPLAIELVVTSPDLAATPRGRRLLERLEAGAQPHAEATESELRKLADTTTPQGVLIVARRPRHRLANFEPRPDCAVVIFDRVADPGNLGTLIRTAHALGAAWAVALPGGVDPWNPKTVRAAAGSSFWLPVSREAWPEVATWLRRREFAILCADASGEPVSRGAPRPRRLALVLGSEPAGSSREVLRDCDRRVAVKLQGAVDSLNVAVAGALLLDRLLAGPEAE